MSRLLNDLDSRLRPIAFELLARFTEAGIMVLIVDTRRTAAEHADNLARGVSWIQRSKHLDGLAIDVCPYETYALHGPDKLKWDPTDPIWTRLGGIGEALGLRWGGRWLKTPDMGHFEFVVPRVPIGVTT